ncbi:uncharacterized protein naa80 isoform X2 [Rhinoraja longicauda]
MACLPLVDDKVLPVVGMLKTWASPPTGAVNRCTELGSGKIERVVDMWNQLPEDVVECEKILTEELRAVPLHYCPELVEACADLINEEWKRSKASRIHTLQKSSNSFPVCLVLKKILKDAGSTSIENRSQLVGHSKLSLVVGKSTGLFVETVVVAKEFRGKGYGRKLMEATEAYAKNRGFKTLYLTTHDKQDFYSHLGYVLTDPVQNAGSISTFMNMEFLEKLAPPTISPPRSSLLSSCLSPHVPSPAPQPPAPPVFAPVQKQRLNLPSAPHPAPSSQPNAPVTFPSSLTASSLQSEQLQTSVSCSSTTSQLDQHVLIPPPPPLPPSIPGLQAAPCSLNTSQLHGQTHACNASSPSPALPISQTSQLHSPSAVPPQRSSPTADLVALPPAPPPLPRASETFSKLFPFVCDLPESCQGKGKATQNQWETPYQCVKGLPVFWMKKDI